MFLLSSLFGIAAHNASSQSEEHPQYVILQANGWMLTIRPDGVARISRWKESNAILETASTASGAVNFEQIKEALSADIFGSNFGQSESLLQAGIWMKGQEKMSLKPVRNIEIWNRLIEQLESKWTGPTLSSFKKAGEKNPLKLELP